MFTENFRRATAELTILHILLDEDMYAYELIQRIAKISNGLYTLPEGTLYPVMYRLTAKGYVSEFSRMINKRMRRYYHLEQSGREYYKALISEYKEISFGLGYILGTNGGDTTESDKNN